MKENSLRLENDLYCLHERNANEIADVDQEAGGGPNQSAGFVMREPSVRLYAFVPATRFQRRGMVSIRQPQLPWARAWSRTNDVTA